MDLLDIVRCHCLDFIFPGRPHGRHGGKDWGATHEMSNVSVLGECEQDVDGGRLDGIHGGLGGSVGLGCRGDT